MPGNLRDYLAAGRVWLHGFVEGSTIELPMIETGESISGSLDSSRDLTLPGEVSSISSCYEIMRGDVTNDVEISLDEKDPRLKWGMTAVVTFASEPCS